MKTINEFEQEVRRFIFLSLSINDNFVIYMSCYIQPPHKQYDLFDTYCRYGLCSEETGYENKQGDIFLKNIKAWAEKYKKESMRYEKDFASIQKMKDLRAELDSLMSFITFCYYEQRHYAG